MKSADEMTLAEHAEAWWAEQGKIVPIKGTPEYMVMYETWTEWAFSDFKKAV